jgi:hypothetical protein
METSVGKLCNTTDGSILSKFLGRGSETASVAASRHQGAEILARFDIRRSGINFISHCSYLWVRVVRPEGSHGSTQGGEARDFHPLVC